MAERRTTERPYAEAAFALARDARRLKPWSGMLGLLAAVVGDAGLQPLLDDPRLPRERLADLIIEICDRHLDSEAQNFVRILAENRRLDLLPQIIELYEIRRAEAEALTRSRRPDLWAARQASAQAPTGTGQKRPKNTTDG